MLNLCSNGIDDEQLAPLLETLRDDNNIQILNLSNNKIRVISSKMTTHKLHDIDLGANNTTVEGKYCNYKIRPIR